MNKHNLHYHLNNQSLRDSFKGSIDFSKITRTHEVNEEEFDYQAGLVKKSLEYIYDNFKVLTKQELIENICEIFMRSSFASYLLLNKSQKHKFTHQQSLDHLLSYKSYDLLDSEENLMDFLDESITMIKDKPEVFFKSVKTAISLVMILDTQEDHLAKFVKQQKSKLIDVEQMSSNMVTERLAEEQANFKRRDIKAQYKCHKNYIYFIDEDGNVLTLSK